MKREYRKPIEELVEDLNSFQEDELYYLIYDEINKYPVNYNKNIRGIWIRYVEIENPEGEIIFSRDIVLFLSKKPFTFKKQKAKKGTKEEIIEEAIKYLY